MAEHTEDVRILQCIIGKVPLLHYGVAETRNLLLKALGFHRGKSPGRAMGSGHIEFLLFFAFAHFSY
ncbi:hypothetical protein ACFX15_002638 [Malus domestica]